MGIKKEASITASLFEKMHEKCMQTCLVIWDGELFYLYCYLPAAVRASYVGISLLGDYLLLVHKELPHGNVEHLGYLIQRGSSDALCSHHLTDSGEAYAHPFRKGLLCHPLLSHYLFYSKHYPMYFAQRYESPEKR